MQTLPLQVAIEPDDTFVSLLDKISSEMFGALLHSPYAASAIGRSYELLLNYHVARIPHFQGSPVRYENVHLGYGQKNLLLQIHDFEQSGQFTLWFEPQLAAFTSEQRQQMPQHFTELLDAFLEDPYQSIHQANLLTAEEKEQLLVTWNDTAAPRQPSQCLHHLFEAQARLTPTAVAVTAGLHQLTYQDLNGRANQLAHYLKKHGVGPETLVGICMERSLEMVVGLMGILKAGGGYVPLDPTYPKDRLAFIAEDAQISILLTQTKVLTGC